MWIRVATDADSVRIGKYGHYYIDGLHMQEFYFDKQTCAELDEDHFLLDMWHEFDTVVDWGDCDFFQVSQCEKLREWLQRKMKVTIPSRALHFYQILLHCCNVAIHSGTGIYFDL